MSESIAGARRNGVNVPDEQRSMGETAMSTTLGAEPQTTIAAEVSVLLKERGAEQQFCDLLALIGKYFPDALSTDVYVQEDCTEPAWLRIKSDVYFVAGSADVDQMLTRWSEFDRQVVDQIPIDYPPLFLVMRCYRQDK